MGKYISPEQRRRRFKICIITVPIVVIALVVLVVGLYFGLHHNHSGNNSTNPSASTSPSPSATSTQSSSILTPTPTPTGTSPIANPVKLASIPALLGNVTSTNTPDVRDGGWAGTIGNTTIITYADTEPCQTYQYGCWGLEASNSAGVATDSPLQYTDIDVKHGHATAFCTDFVGENEGVAIWLSNVVPTGEDTGIVFYIRLNRNDTQNEYIEGGGVAKINIVGKKPTCSNQTTQWWDQTEHHYGDHNALHAPDGYIYAFGGGGGGSGSGGSSLFVTRVLPASADDLSAYEYWNGEEYTSTRLYNSPSSAVVMENGQGTVLYSPFYEQYIYFAPNCYGGQCITVQAASRPEGPWSNSTIVYGSGDSPNGYAMYAPAVQPQYSNSEMQYLVLTFVGHGADFGNIIQAINMTFTKD